jgi:hypothetical protein
MGKRLLIVVLVVFFSGSVAFALDPLGPPTAELKQGQFRVGIEYFYETSDIQLHNGKFSYFYAGVFQFSEEVENFDMKVKEQMITANVGYGLTDNWEAFVRLGGEVCGEASGYMPDEDSDITFDGDSSFVIGFGTKATVYEQGKVRLGALFQMNWADSDGKINSSDWDYSYSADIDTLEWAIAVGPSYQLNETVSIYGGPFLYFLDGDVTAKASGPPGIPWEEKICYDLEESSSVGGYIGANFDFAENLSYNVEWLHTHDADAIAMMLAWKF